MRISETELLRAKNLLAAAKRIIILSHRGPDGDTVGANLGLRRALKYQWGKEVVSACIDAPPASCNFLPEFNAYVRDFDQSWADLIVTVDCGAHYMTKFHETKPDLFAGKPPTINIDHHASNDYFGQVNIVDPIAASATQIVYGVLKYCGFQIDRAIATCLLNGLYYDTGSFMHSNTTPEVLEVAADLMWRGADFKTIARRQFHTMPIKQLKVYGKIFERMRVNDKKVTVSALSSIDFSTTEGSSDDTTGAIDFLNAVPDGDFCCLLYEERDQIIKGSFRSRVDDIDLSKLAGIFGGGGHKKAAGFSFPGRLLETATRITIGA